MNEAQVKAQAQSPATGKDVRSRRENIERKLWRLWKPLRQKLKGNKQRTYIFVAGMQRSGTNMLMELLEWGGDTDVYHETDSRAFNKYEMRARPVIHELAKQSPAAFFIIKSLCELDQIKSLMDEFQPAKTLWIVRAYDDSISSAIRSFGNFTAQLHRLVNDKEAAEWRGRGMSDETQELLKKLDHPEINEASAAALMWYYRNVLFFEQGLNLDSRVKLIFYEDLVSEPQVALKGVFKFLTMPNWSPWISRYIHARSVRKSPRTDIEPGVREICEELTNRFAALSRQQIA
jgi:hypothetical protein